MWTLSARAFHGLTEAALFRPLAIAAALLWSVAAAQACESVAVARNAALFTSCDLPWRLIQSNAEEEIYFCDGDGCPDETILRFTVEEMTQADRALDRNALMIDWTKRQLPEAMDGYTIETLDPINVRTFNEITGIMIAMRLTETATGTRYVSLAFRIPRQTDYVVPNVTGRGEMSELYPLLAQALNGLSLQEEKPQ